MGRPISEAQTISELVLPSLRSAGWPDAAIRRELPITAGGRTVAAGRIRKGSSRYADIALLHHVGSAPVGHPICVVEAKRTREDERRGVQQAMEYGRMLDLPLVYATNGRKVIEIDLAGGTRREVESYRAPGEIWANFTSVKRLSSLGIRLFETPYSRAISLGDEVKAPRYYQHVAIQRILQAIAAGQNRVLAVLATGTGKSFLAAQLVHSLWQACWPRGERVPDRRPRVLYLADRDVLVGDPLVRDFQPIFGTEEAVRVQGEIQTQARINFATYQAMDTSNLFSRHAPDWFDLVIVDECHRGSAAADSQWRQILDYFSSAVHLGLTATPRADSEADTYQYFGEPVYSYSLRQGIADGFLAPFEVIRVQLSTDLDGVNIEQGTVDDQGIEIPAKNYRIEQLERTLVVPERTEEAASWLSRYLAGRNRMAKTIVFCVNQDHAARFAEAIGNLNPDLMVEFDSEWSVRITSDEGERGKRLLSRFQSTGEPVPVVVTSSDMLTTGVDAPAVRNIVFFTPVKSMTKFKQMLGRGTRLDADAGKEFFTVVDFTGVTALFADPTFDGPPVRTTETSSGEPDPGTDVEVVDGNESGDSPEDGAPTVEEPLAPFTTEPGGSLEPGANDDSDVIDDPAEVDEIDARGTRHVVRGIDVTVLGEYLYVVEEGPRFALRAIRIESWTRRKVLDLGYDPDSLRRQWAATATRRALLERLGPELPFTLEELADRLGYAESDPLDMLLALAFDVPQRSRRERMEQFTRSQKAFMAGFGGQAREVLELILQKYAEHGPGDLEPRVLAVPPLTELGSVTELARRFGGPGAFRDALDQLGRRLYEAS